MRRLLVRRKYKISLPLVKEISSYRLLFPFARREPKKTTASSLDLTELGLSASPDHSRLTTMGRFLADEGIGRMERLIHPLVQAQPQSTKEGVGESSSNNRTTSSVVVEIESVCSLDTYRIMRDFGKK